MGEYGGKERVAEKTYQTSKKDLKKDKLYFFELTSIYFKNNDREKLTSHLLSGLDNNIVGLNYIENTLQGIYEEKDYEKLELELLSRIQKSENDLMLNELLIWLYYQQKDFESALIQAKALDKKQKEEGT